MVNKLLELNYLTSLSSILYFKLKTDGYSLTTNQEFWIIFFRFSF